jgi:hypothetical protein
MQNHFYFFFFFPHWMTEGKYLEKIVQTRQTNLTW